MKAMEKLMILIILGCGFHAFLQENLELFVVSLGCYFVSKFALKELKN